jgi:hypothetical protein
MPYVPSAVLHAVIVATSRTEELVPKPVQTLGITDKHVAHMGTCD